MWNKLFSLFSINKFHNEKIDTVVLFLGVAVLILTWYILRNRKRGNLPPGPMGLPIFGYYFPLRNKPIETLKELAKKYGNVMGLYIGSKYVVFLNDWEAVKDAFGQNTTLHRPNSQIHKIPYKFGFGGSNGAEWVETRRLASKAMKDGLQQNHLEDLIQEEISDTTRILREKQGSPVEIVSFFSESFTSNIITITIGERLNIGHSVRKMISKTVNLIVENIKTLAMDNFSESISTLLHILKLEETPPFLQELNEFVKFTSKTVDDNKDSNSMISRFHEEIESRKKINPNTYATEDNLKGTIMVLLIGGSETVRTGVLWALIAMADHPEKQRKVHEELDRAIGKKDFVRWSERFKVPYTLATLLESLRWRTTGPFPGMRMASEDTKIQGYSIPKGTYIVTNNWLLHNDPRYWEKPDQFIPERFLLEDGRKVNMAPESFNPFSYGKRNCPGKLMSYIIMLHYFSSLMQKFKVVPKEGKKVKYDAVLGLSYQARNAELRFLPR